MHYSEKYGSHPGTGILIALCFLGGVSGGFLGALIMFAVFCPIYLVGAYERGDDK